MVESRESIEETLEGTKRMRDRLRVQMELAKADARDEWAKAEKKWSTLQAELDRLRERSSHTLEDLSADGKRLLQDIKETYQRLSKGTSG